MGWATATLAEGAMTTETDTETTDAIYSGGAEAEDADADADTNYYPSPGGPSILASSVDVRGVHLALPGGFCLFWYNTGENKRFRQKGGVGRGRGIGKGVK